VTLCYFETSGYCSYVGSTKLNATHKGFISLRDIKDNDVDLKRFICILVKEIGNGPKASMTNHGVL
jgi:hypothetical protein